MNKATQACTSKTVYRTLPLKAGFLTAPEARGANVVAALRANFATSLSTSNSMFAVIS